MEDEKILDLYFARDEQAIARTDQKYGTYCFSLANNILRSPPDSEETVNDTYLRAWNAIPPQRPQVLKLFLARITRNLAFSRWRSLSAGKRGGGEMDLVLEELAGCLAAPNGAEDRLEARELSRAIRTFLDSLPVREQGLFLRRYFFVEETEVIAARFGMKPESVRRQLSRTRLKLKNYLLKEGYTL